MIALGRSRCFGSIAGRRRRVGSKGGHVGIARGLIGGGIDLVSHGNGRGNERRHGIIVGRRSLARARAVVTGGSTVIVIIAATGIVVVVAATFGIIVIVVVVVVAGMGGSITATGTIGKGRQTSQSFLSLWWKRWYIQPGRNNDNSQCQEGGTHQHVGLFVVVGSCGE